MFNEALFNVANIALALGVLYVGYQTMNKAGGKTKSAIMYVVLAAAVLGVAEVIDLFQVFPDGTLLSNLVYEKEIPVLVLLFLAVNSLKGSKK